VDEVGGILADNDAQFVEFHHFLFSDGLVDEVWFKFEEDLGEEQLTDFLSEEKGEIGVVVVLWIAFVDKVNKKTNEQMLKDADVNI
jgi:hypothetical protein